MGLAVKKRICLFILMFAVAWIANTGTARADQSPLSLVSYLESPLVDQQKGQIKGLVIEIVKTLFRRQKIPYEINLAPPKRALRIAQTQKNSCVFPIDRSQEREVDYQWVSPVLVSRHAFYSSSERQIPLTTIKDAKPYVVGSYLGSGIGEYLDSLGFKVDFARRNELNAQKLQMQRIDLWASDTISAQYLAEQKGYQLAEPELVFFSTIRAMGCNLAIDRSRIKSLQAELTKMYHDGTIDSIYKSHDARLLY